MAIAPDHVAADSLVGVQRQQTNAGRWPAVGWNAFRDTLVTQGIELLEEPSTRGIFATDAGGTAYGMPHGVVIARNAAQISVLLKAAQTHRVLLPKNGLAMKPVIVRIHTICPRRCPDKMATGMGEA